MWIVGVGKDFVGQIEIGSYGYSLGTRWLSRSRRERLSLHVWFHLTSADGRYVIVSVTDDLDDLKNAPRPLMGSFYLVIEKKR